MCDGYLTEGTAPTALDADGWYRTGDLAVALPAGKFRLVERASEAVKLSNGCFVCPSRLQQQFEKCPEVRIIVLFVDSRRTGLLAIAQAAMSGSPPSRQQVLAALVGIAREAELRAWEVPRDVHVVCDEWSIAGGHLTASGKPCRPGLRNAYSAALEAMELRLVRREQALAGRVQVVLQKGACEGVLANLPYSLDAPPLLDSRAAVALSGALAREFSGVDVPPALLLRATDPVSVAAQLIASVWPQGGASGSEGADATEELISGRPSSSPQRAVSAVDWREEATLPLDVRPVESAVATGRHYLLTGATGFLGSFVLQELLDGLPLDVQVHCIVRAKDDEAAAERLRGVALANKLAFVADICQWGASSP